MDIGRQPKISGVLPEFTCFWLEGSVKCPCGLSLVRTDHLFHVEQVMEDLKILREDLTIHNVSTSALVRGVGLLL